MPLVSTLLKNKISMQVDATKLGSKQWLLTLKQVTCSNGCLSTPSVGRTICTIGLGLYVGTVNIRAKTNSYSKYK